MQLKGTDLLIETLIDQGVTDLFGFPGGTVIDIFESLAKYSDRIQCHLVSHEQHAAHAADGYARATGKVGVCLATSGPGATNLVTGVATAMLDSIPMVAITGNVGTNFVGKDSFQEIDITGISMHVTKHNYFVNDIKDLPSVLREAFKIAKSGRPGPVLVDIPKDVQNSMGEFEALGPVKPYKKIEPESDRLERAAELIREAERPYVYIGGGVITTGVYDEVLELADRLDAVIGTSLMGLSAVPTDHPRFLGMAGMHGHYASTVAQNEADCIIAVGTRFSDRTTGDTKKFAKKASIVHLDVDFAEFSKNIPANVGVRGDLSLSLRQLIDLLEKQTHPEWQEYVGELVKKEQSFEPLLDEQMTPQTILEAINQVRTPETVMVTDVGQHQMWAAQYLRFQKPRTFLSSGGLGTMGFGMGAAIGAGVGTGNNVILITGDGSFGMNFNELPTAVQNKVPLTVVIMNNGVLGMVRQWQTLYDLAYSGTTLTDRKVDYIKLAEAFGARGVRAETPEKLKEELVKASESGEVTLIECPIDKDELVLPMLPPGYSIADMIKVKEEI